VQGEGNIGSRGTYLVWICHFFQKVEQALVGGRKGDGELKKKKTKGKKEIIKEGKMAS